VAELFETTPIHIQDEVVESLDVIDEEIVLVVLPGGAITGPGGLQLYRDTSDLVLHIFVEFPIRVFHFVGLRISIKVCLIVLVDAAFGLVKPTGVLQRWLLVENRRLESDASSAAVEWRRGSLLLARWVVSALGHLRVDGQS